MRPRDATPADPVFVWMKTFVSHESHSRYLEAPYVIEFLAATKAWVIEAKTVISDIVTPSLPMTRAVFSDSQRVRLCIFQVNLLKLDTFVSQLKSIQFVAKTVAEPLCLAYYWVQDTANPNVFAALQAFAPGGLEAHNASAHTSQLSPVWQECVEAVEVTEGFALGNLGSGIGVPKLDSGSHAAARRSSIHQMPDLSPPPLPLPARSRRRARALRPIPDQRQARRVARDQAEHRTLPSSGERGGALLCHAANRSQPTGRLGRAASDRSGPAFTRGAARRHRAPAPTVACRARGGVIRVLRGLAERRDAQRRGGRGGACERRARALRRRRAIGPLHQAGAREGRRPGCDRDLGYRLRFGSLSFVFIA